MGWIHAATVIAILSTSACAGRSDETLPRHASSTQSPLTPAESSSTSSSETPSPVGSTRLVIPDPINDVWHTFNDGDQNPKRVHQPRADLVQVMVRHGRQVVTIHERVGDLRPLDFQSYFVRVQTRNETYSLQSGTTGASGVRRPLWLDLGKETGGDGDTVACPEAFGEADFERDQLTFTLPRTCLGAPAWVRVSVEIWLVNRHDEEFTDYMDGDQARPDGYSRRIYSG